MMPDILGQLDKKERNRVAKSLTHYLISLNKKDDFEVTVPDSVAAEKVSFFFIKSAAQPATPQGIKGVMN